VILCIGTRIPGPHWIDETVNRARYANRLCEICDDEKRNEHTCERDHHPVLKNLCVRCLFEGPPR